MQTKTAFAAALLCLVAAALGPVAAAQAREKSTGVVGWYNGDWQSGMPGLQNWYLSRNEFARVYDDFLVPAGGWTVVGVFSNNALLDFARVERASWEIRRSMSAGKGGKVVASGLSRATQAPDPSVTLGQYPAQEVASHFRIEVDGLHVQLAPGRYWLSVTPVGRGVWYVSATRGAHAAGEPPGNNGWALSRTSPFRSVRGTEAGPGGDAGIAIDFSQGVVIAAPRSAPQK